MKGENNYGFTLVELIIVIVLIGIVAIYVAPKISISSFKEDSDIMQFLSNVRYAQHESMVTGSNWRIKIDSSNSEYLLDNDSDDSNNLPEIPSQDNPVNVESNIAATLNEFYFDYFGRPVNSSNNFITSQIIVTIGSKNIIVEPYSGGVYVQ